MPKTIEVPLPIRIEKLTQVMRIRGVPVYVHWSVFLVSAWIVSNAIRRPLTSVVGLLAYLGVLFIHEVGHLVAAQKLHTKVISIKLYPIFGITHFEVPWSRFDHCVIAWGGVIGQAIVGLPAVLLLALIGYSRVEALNALLVILGYFSVAVAAFNLLPVRPLDGATAWGIIPEYIKRLRHNKVDRRWKR